MKRSLMKVIVFIIIGVALFSRLQEVLRTKSDDLYLEQMGGFEIMENNTIDALFFGGSTVAYGVSPMRIYESTGITSYNLGMGMQPLDVSYYRLKWALHTQKPRVVMVNASGLFSNYTDSFVSENAQTTGSFTANSPRAIWMDMLPFGVLKLEMAQALLNLPAWENNFIETIFPIVRYHSRWSELNRKDFKLGGKEPFYSMGGFFYAQSEPATVTLDEIEQICAEMKKRNAGTAEYSVEGKHSTQTVEMPLYLPTISEEGKNYLKAMQELCAKNGTEIALINIPSIHYPQSYANPWNSELAGMVKNLAREWNIPFYDFTLDYDIVDYQQDSSDGGFHLNIRGVEKVSDVIGGVLQDDFHCKGGANPVFEEMMPSYQHFRRVAMLESERDFDEYLEKLSQNLKDWTILISACNEYTGTLNPQEYDFFANELHLDLIEKGGYTDSYIAVINAGDVVLEGVSDRRISQNVTVNGLDIALISSGWYSGPKASVMINGEEYAQNSGGLNIVVIDNETGQVIDSAAFDTQLVTKPCHRSWDDTNAYLRQYEQFLLG